MRQLAAIVLIATCWTAPAQAAEFRAIGDFPAVLYDAPSLKANKVGILGRHYPVEVVVKLEKWAKVRDADREMAWVENALLAEKRTVLVIASPGEVRAQPNPSAALVFEAQKSVLLELVGAATDGWIPVRHRDGQQGFIKAAQVWGE